MIPRFIRGQRCPYCGIRIRGSSADIKMRAHQSEAHLIEQVIEMLPFLLASTLAISTIQEAGL